MCAFSRNLDLMCDIFTSRDYLFVVDKIYRLSSETLEAKDDGSLIL